jgi:hypothetical protein
MSLRARIVLSVVAVMALVPVAASAHGGFGARAAQPSFNDRTLRLSGVGGYGTTRAHRAIRVTVCLEKRYRGSFFNVKCKTAYDSDHRVRARVGVAGCVRGVWRTTAAGEALGRGGEWRHAASAAGDPYRCA